ncbi:MAG TPA: hypothetical protein VKQ72_17925 [Aggregatilineales bacterium]|nr:hypothetical protein [Aggregatilineales bacterium]
MCLFCAAIPATVSVGAAARGKINERRQRAEADGSSTGKYNYPIAKITLALVAILLVCAVTYHTVIWPRFGI